MNDLDDLNDQAIFKVNGVYVYDPRIDKWIISDNPALIFGDFVMNRNNLYYTKYKNVDEKKFWQWIADWANYCDETISVLD